MLQEKHFREKNCHLQFHLSLCLNNVKTDAGKDRAVIPAVKIVQFIPEIFKKKIDLNLIFTYFATLKPIIIKPKFYLSI